MKFFDKIRYGLRIPQILNTVTENKRLLITNNKLLRELDWANVFNNTIKGSEWFNNHSISPGRWAVGYSFLYVLYRILNDVKPLKILEFGLGQSTKMLHAYANWNNKATIKTIDSSIDWINYYDKSNMPQNCEIAYVEELFIEYKGKNTRSLKEFKDLITDEKYNLILIDAPIGSEHYSRPQIIKLVENNLDLENFCIIIDDYQRQGEKETTEELKLVFNNLNIKYEMVVYQSEKDFTLFVTPNLKFLLSL